MCSMLASWLFTFSEFSTEGKHFECGFASDLFRPVVPSVHVVLLSAGPWRPRVASEAHASFGREHVLPVLLGLRRKHPNPVVRGKAHVFSFVIASN